MTATATQAPTIHDTLGDLLTHGIPGDQFHDTTDRMVITYVFLERQDNGDDVGGLVRSITTRHHGRPDYQYLTAAHDNVHTTDGTFIRIDMNLSGPYLRLGAVPAKRYSATRIQQIHDQAVSDQPELLMAGTRLARG